ncbi:SufD family Fe-S cluster assembly protein [Chloroflexota bacterium]
MRAKYSEIAKKKQQTFCSSCDTNPHFQAQAAQYFKENREDIPPEILIRLGCGNPVAIAELKSGERVLELGAGAGTGLSHEAAIGKLAKEKVEHLITRGLSRTKATTTMVRGLLKVAIKELPPILNTELQSTMGASENEFMRIIQA